MLKIKFSNTLPVVDKRLIGHKFEEKSGSLPSFGRVMNFASFRGAGKRPSRSQLLNICLKCTRGLLENCRRYSFGIPSKPQTFPNFKDCIYLRCHRVGS